MGPPKPRGKPPPKPAPPKAPKLQKAPKREDSASAASSLPFELQQLLINIFKDSFAERFSVDIKPLLQEVKGHLYNRDFATAFGKEEYLEAYALRWSPSRALCYLQILLDLKEQLGPFTERIEGDQSAPWNVVALGGGAGAEIVALGGLMKMLDSSDAGGEHKPEVKISALDIADWANVVEKLREGVVTKPPLSKYASAALQAANVPLLSDASTFGVSFHKNDVLNTPKETLKELVKDAHIVTLMFTLNELYTTSLSLTQSFLLNLTAFLKPGSHLLVVDSPGSYSTISLNGAPKKYPMQWLLDHTLLASEGKASSVAPWDKIASDESKWFRLDERLRYPIELENMRYQLHLYRRTG